MNKLYLLTTLCCTITLASISSLLGGTSEPEPGKTYFQYQVKSIKTPFQCQVAVLNKNKKAILKTSVIEAKQNNKWHKGSLGSVKLKGRFKISVSTNFSYKTTILYFYYDFEENGNIKKIGPQKELLGQVYSEDTHKHQTSIYAKIKHWEKIEDEKRNHYFQITILEDKAGSN